ncbi:MAG TPA: hypothetical protein VMN04_02510 [Thermoanaerobaculia bacterium]|nr:hypothetical protein [Thermoanaerobaculia bacterium]
MPTIEVEADFESDQVVQTIRSPQGEVVVVGTTLDETIRLIEGLIRVGSRLAEGRYEAWAEHLSSLTGGAEGTRGRAKTWLKIWRRTRPEPGAARLDIIGAAEQLALDVCAGTPYFSAESISILAHVHDGTGRTLAKMPNGMRAKCEASGHVVLPWDTL